MEPESLLRRLPADWQSELANTEPVETGFSNAVVMRVVPADGEPHYLKIAEGAEALTLRRELERSVWLAAHGISVPQVQRVFEDGTLMAVLSAAMRGGPASSDDASAAIVAPIARALARLHRLPVENCPFDERLDIRLVRARADIEAGAVDPSQFDDRNRSRTPEAIYLRLLADRPASEDLVVVHGDATLDNIFVDPQGEVGFIDCGHAGRADRYVDLALVTHDIAELFGASQVPVFMHCYGLAAWDPAKALFYRDLYELF